MSFFTYINQCINFFDINHLIDVNFNDYVLDDDQYDPYIVAIYNFNY